MMTPKLMTASLVLVMATLAGCGASGTCTVICTFDDGDISTHGPYDNYSRAECDEQASISESPGITTCYGEWD
jgi:hypothetical protein